MDLIHPETKAEVVDVLRDATARGRRILPVGGRQHLDKGNPSTVDAELWTTQLDRAVSYEPAEMVAVVEAGMRVGHLQGLLAEGGQEWPVDAPEAATVGGVIAAGASAPRRLKVGHVRDTVLEMELVTGDGRFVRSGARTVKNVTGYDLHKLLVGSLGTLGVIVQVALKARPLPAARRRLRGPGGLEEADLLVDGVPGAAAVLATSQEVEVRLEGWPEELEAQSDLVRRILPEGSEEDDPPEPALATMPDAAVLAEAAVPPSRLGELLAPPLRSWEALAGVGIAWVGLAEADGELDALRTRATALGGIAPVIRGPGGLGRTVPPALVVQRRVKRALDPAGVLAPGRGWTQETTEP